MSNACSLALALSLSSLKFFFPTEKCLPLAIYQRCLQQLCVLLGDLKYFCKKENFGEVVCVVDVVDDVVVVVVIVGLSSVLL